MYSRLARTSLGALVTLLTVSTFATPAHADAKSAAKCSAAIIKAGAGLVQAEAKILQKCRDTTLKGKTCDQVKTQASIDKARAKLASTIQKACWGKDKSCTTEDADGSQPTLTEIGWNIGNCPDFEGAGCTNAIANCNDIPTCIQCIGEASVNQAIDLYYPPNRPSSVGDKTLNKCQQAIGKAGLTYLAARSKNLSKCWGKKVKKTATCPADALAKINAAKAKIASSIGKKCAGLDDSTIGLPAGCLAVTPEGGSSCAASVSSVTDVASCLGCVTDFKVDCPDRASAVSVGATYPPECLVVPPTPTPTATATPEVATPTETATPMPTATSTPNALCGNGALDQGEVCDPGLGSPQTSCPNVDGGQFPCDGNTCTCACPSKVAFAGDATDPKSLLDTGWTGISHRAPIISDGAVTVALSCAAGGRPCGTCTIAGPIANTEPGQIDDQRCNNDTAIKCSDDTPCTPGGGTCEFFFGSNLPLAAGGISTCVVNQFNGPVSGTANVESGDAATTALLTSHVYNGLAIDNPCPRCVGDTTVNDGLAGGTCDGGPHQGDACDGNGTIPSRPDFGTTSLDCPPPAGGVIATLPIDLSNRTAPVTKTLSTSSPNCTGSAGDKCLCDTCNNVNADPCFTNADCPMSGGSPGICGSKRCVSGANAGAPCTTPSECPGGSCARIGEPTKPSGCTDDTTMPGNRVMECADGGDGEGACTIGPTDQNCTLASGHAQRGCTSDANCGGGVGSCESIPRRCFLTGGGTFQAAGKNDGTDTLTAVGQADAPVNDVSNPTLAAVFCVGPTSAPAVNNVAGLPGPSRVTIKGQARGLP